MTNVTNNHHEAKMRLRSVAAIVCAILLGLPFHSRLALGDARQDSAVQTALDIGRSVGAASACPNTSRPRIKGMTDRFRSLAQAYGTSPQDTQAILQGFDLGVAYGQQAVRARQITCDTADRDLGDWERSSLPPFETAAAPPAAVRPPPAPRASDLAPVSSAPVLSAPSGIPAATAIQPVAALPLGGIDARTIRLGMVGPFSGPAAEVGRQMRLGLETAFSSANDAGGVHGRQLKLITADDGYEPARTAEAMKTLYEKERVFGFVGNVGTPTTAVALPYALSNRALFFGAVTGAPLLRNDPPDRYVFNYRASYAEETAAIVHFLVKTRRIRLDQIAVFAQQDGFGDAGFEGVTAAVRALSAASDTGAVPRFGYQRNTDDVDAAVQQLIQHNRQRNQQPIKAVIMVATARAAAKFIERSFDRVSGLTYTNVSFVGSTALSKELMALGPKYAAGVIVTQVVPAVDSYASVVLTYKEALGKYFPGEAPDYVSFEGYLTATVLLEALRRAGPQLDTERLVTTLEALRDLDLGVGPRVNFSTGDHQSLHKVWGTQLDETGRFKPINLE